MKLPVFNKKLRNLERRADEQNKRANRIIYYCRLYICISRKGEYGWYNEFVLLTVGRRIGAENSSSEYYRSPSVSCAFRLPLQTYDGLFIDRFVNSAPC